MKLNAAAYTHVGKVRGNNEDNCYFLGEYRTDINRNEQKFKGSTSDEDALFAVCDGMGGEAAGEEASLMAVRHLRPASGRCVQAAACQSIQEANTEICEEIKKMDNRRMGSTLAALYVQEGKAVSCNIGDSRVYLLREGALRQLSTDHNRAQSMVRMGLLTPQQAHSLPSRHELTQHLGIFAEEMLLEPAFVPPIAMKNGDSFLLCSDGLTDMLTDEKICEILRQKEMPEVLCDKLVAAALENGGKDNVTVLVVQVGDSDSFWQRLFGAAK